MTPPRLDRVEELPLDAPAVMTLRRGGVLDLADQVRHDEPQEQPDQVDQREVVKEYAERARNLSCGQPIHAGAHRRGARDGEEEQCDHDLELPERERGNDHRDRCRNQRGACYRAADLPGYLRLGPLLAFTRRLSSSEQAC